jgi:hypothetical protein
MRMRRMRVADPGVRATGQCGKAARKRLFRDYASIRPGAGRVQLKRVIAEGPAWVRKCVRQAKLVRSSR